MGTLHLLLMVLLGALAFFIAVKVVTQFMIVVQQSTVVVMKRFGRHHRVLLAGPHFVWPLIDRVQRVFSSQRSAIALPLRVAFSRGVPVNIDVTLELRSIIDPKIAARLAYELAQPLEHLQVVATQALLQFLLPLNYDTVLAQSEDGSLARKLQDVLAEIAPDCGFDVPVVRITRIIPELAVQEATEDRACAEIRRTTEAATATHDAALLKQRAEATANAAKIEAEAQREVTSSLIGQVSSMIKMLMEIDGMTHEDAIAVVNGALYHQALLTAVNSGNPQVNLLPADLGAPTTANLAQPLRDYPIGPGKAMPDER